MLFRSEIFRELFEEGHFSGEHILYGNALILGDSVWATDNKIYDGPFDLEKLFRRNICHQSIFYPRSAIEKIGFYNERYSVTADWDYNIHCWSVYPFRYVDKTIAQFRSGGVSSKAADQAFMNERHHNIVRYFNLNPADAKYDYSETPFYFPVSQYLKKEYLKTIKALEERVNPEFYIPGSGKPRSEGSTLENYPKISIVTPNLNGEAFLEDTILSVIGQQYPNLEYIVIDGGSTDRSLEIIRKYKDFITCWESTTDNGLYHAIQKGFEKSTGEIMGWINSDDILCYNSLFSVAEIFSLDGRIDWVQGHPTVIDDNNRIVYQRPPVFSWQHFFTKAYNDGRFIQQESTFWSRKLWNKAGGYISRDYKFAGDFELWIRFFDHAPLFVTEAVLGAFRMRSNGQLSRENYSYYLDECDDIINRMNEKSDAKENASRINTENDFRIIYNMNTFKFQLITN